MRYVFILLLLAACKKEEIKQCEIDGVAQFTFINNTTDHYDLFIDGVSTGRIFANQTRTGNNITRGHHDIKIVHYQKTDSTVTSRNVVPCEDFTLYAE